MSNTLLVQLDGEGDAGAETLYGLTRTPCPCAGCTQLAAVVRHAVEDRGFSVASARDVNDPTEEGIRRDAGHMFTFEHMQKRCACPNPKRTP